MGRDARRSANDMYRHRFLEDCKKTFSLFLVYKRPKRSRTSTLLTMTGIWCITSLRPPGFHRHQGGDYPEGFQSGVWISSFRQMKEKSRFLLQSSLSSLHLSVNSPNSAKREILNNFHSFTKELNFLLSKH